MNRLVAVSNRIGPVSGSGASGGLAVALVDALRESRGIWFGWSGRVGRNAETTGCARAGPAA